MRWTFFQMRSMCCNMYLNPRVIPDLFLVWFNRLSKTNTLPQHIYTHSAMTSFNVNKAHVCSLKHRLKDILYFDTDYGCVSSKWHLLNAQDKGASHICSVLKSGFPISHNAVNVLSQHQYEYSNSTFDFCTGSKIRAMFWLPLKSLSLYTETIQHIGLLSFAVNKWKIIWKSRIKCNK